MNSDFILPVGITVHYRIEIPLFHFYLTYGSTKQNSLEYKILVLKARNFTAINIQFAMWTQNGEIR